jgi:serine/threonine protein kinase
MRRCPQCGTDYPDDVAFCGHDGAINVAILPPGSAADPRLGARLGDYVVVAPVADGAMGRVYEARHADTKKKVAVKILHAEVARDGIAVERFKREFETARDIESKHVVRVIDFGETGEGSYYLTMEYLEGDELGNLLRASGALATGRLLRVLCQVALGLDDAHAFGVIHRDLKPDNLFLVKTPAGDDVRVLDFGSVKLQMETGPKLTAFGTTLGSPFYMSPEQAMGKADVDNRSDVLALGAITYEMITGKIAFQGASVAEILLKIVNQMPEPVPQVKPGTPYAVSDAIEKALAKDKRNRFPSTIEFAAAVLRGFGLDARPDRSSVEAWGARTASEIEAEIAARKTAPPDPAADVPPVAVPAPSSPAPQPSSLSVPAPPGTGNSLWVGLAIVAVLALVGAVVAAAVLLSS